jgi:DeoR family transcriptional regulator, copper-sensing transcriptional repressor
MDTLTPRQQQIIRLVNQKGDISVREIQQTLGISQATAYREIQEITQQGLVVKVPGGVIQVRNSANRCIQCGRENNPRTIFLFEQSDGEKFAACCSHCGLMALAKRANISLATTSDFFYGTLLNASQAWYVLNADINLCCRPTTLSFSSEEDARRFILGFGGELLDFSAAQNKIREMMAFPG